MEKISEYKIIKNIIAKAREEGKTLEGVYFSNKADDYAFCIDKLSIIANITSKEVYHITYFKVTKSGKMKTYNF